MEFSKGFFVGIIFSIAFSAIWLTISKWLSQ